MSRHIFRHTQLYVAALRIGAGVVCVGGEQTRWSALHGFGLRLAVPRSPFAAAMSTESLRTNVQSPGFGDVRSGVLRRYAPPPSGRPLRAHYERAEPLRSGHDSPLEQCDKGRRAGTLALHWAVIEDHPEGWAGGRRANTDTFFRSSGRMGFPTVKRAVRKRI